MNIDRKFYHIFERAEQSTIRDAIKTANGSIWKCKFQISPNDSIKEVYKTFKIETLVNDWIRMGGMEEEEIDDMIRVFSKCLKKLQAFKDHDVC